jgi:uncharacterized protein YgbK (DUF1537 family)
MKRSSLDSLAPAAAKGDLERVRELVGASGLKVVILDDDPTGTQTVHGLDILAEWSVDLLAGALADPRPCFYVLTNTRSQDAEGAAAVIGEVASNLGSAGRLTGVAFTIVTRSDSTLRGHFAVELESIERSLGVAFDAKIIIPAFFEGGRFTINDVHYVADGENLVPAAETEFARDRTFGYRHSSLPEWIEEKTAGAVPAGSVASIPIDMLRGEGGADAVQARLLDLPKGSFVVVNAAAYPDLEVFTLGLLGAEAAGKRFLVRSAASFVRVRAGIVPTPLLTAAEITAAGSGRGMIVVGSYVGKTTAQLESLLGLPGVVGTELVVDRLSGALSRSEEVARVAAAAEDAMSVGKHAVIFTSRGLESAVGAAGDLKAGRIVSEALVDVVRAVQGRPGFILAKGGVTSSDVAIHGLGMKKARVLGQASAGVPVWEMGPETRFPGMKLIIWPGNVGSPDALRDFIREM